VVEWLDPSRLFCKEWWEDLTRALGESRYWVFPGHSDESRFMKELLWGGRMFGAFNDNECNIVRKWIDGLSPPLIMSYASFTGRGEGSCAFLGSHTFLKSRVELPIRPDTVGPLRQYILNNSPGPSVHHFYYPINVTALERVKALPAVWFSHFCLLERFVTIPSKNGNALNSLILSVLRAQYGFRELQYSVAGKSLIGYEDSATDDNSFFEMGNQILAFHDFASVSSFSELISLQSSGDLPRIVAGVSTSPCKCHSLLVGMAAAFISLHRTVAASSILYESTRRLLSRMADIEEENLLGCLRILQDEDSINTDFSRGFNFVRNSLMDIFK
jgi:hypothetical protein